MKAKITEKKKDSQSQNTRREHKKKIHTPSYEKYRINRINTTKHYWRIVKNDKIILILFLPKICNPNKKKWNKEDKQEYGEQWSRRKKWEEEDRIEKIDNPESNSICNIIRISDMNWEWENENSRKKKKWKCNITEETIAKKWKWKKEKKERKITGTRFLERKKWNIREKFKSVDSKNDNNCKEKRVYTRMP